MSRLASPLRYPGGKSCLLDIASYILEANDLFQKPYAEPYSGGCGLALSLLFLGRVSQVHLNDLDRSVWAFWKAVTEHTDDLIQMIEETPVTTAEWQRQRQVQAYKQDAEVLELGFSTFFLNRTNRSGVIHSGGVIGGKEQLGEWKIDCRYNKPDLQKRIARVASYRNRIRLYNTDAEEFMGLVGDVLPRSTVMYIDPPYFEKGSQLYQNSYRPADHVRIATRVSQLRTPWFMTYDNVPEVTSLYRSFRQVPLDIGYSVQTSRRGSEVLIGSPDIKLPLVTSLRAA